MTTVPHEIREVLGGEPDKAGPCETIGHVKNLGFTFYHRYNRTHLKYLKRERYVITHMVLKEHSDSLEK